MEASAPHTLENKIQSLVPEVDISFRTELKHLVTMRNVGYSVGVLLGMSRLSLQLVDKILACAGIRRPSDNLYDCIVTAAKGDEHKRGERVLPDEMASYLHTIRTLSNKADHAGESVILTVFDAENALSLYLRVLEWFYCEYGAGLRLSSIFFEMAPDQPISTKVAAEIENNLKSTDRIAAR